MKTLVLIRGHPGSGKTTYARKINNLFKYTSVEVCADYYFEQGGEYKFDASKLPKAHEWCRQKTREYLQNNMYEIVIVHNTFTKLWEMEKYLQMASDLGVSVEVVKMSGDFENVHGVPDEKVQQMKDRYEPYSNERVIQTSGPVGSQI